CCQQEPLYPFSAVGNNVLFMHKSVVTNNVYIEHRPHPHFCNAIKQGYTFNLLTVCQARRDKMVVVIIICS
ncbi:TPA: hypothetical protein ACSA24_004549, partial [Salmonella enterica subsp. enterica serovar Paratyphi A]